MEIYGVVLTDRFTNTAFLFFKEKTALINIGHKGDRLRKKYMDSLIIRDPLVELIGVDNGAILYTGCTARTFAFNDVARFFDQRYPEISCCTFYALDLGIGQGFNICMPVDLDQFRGKYSYRTFICRKSFIKLGHMAPDGRAFVHQAHPETGGSKIQRGLNAADSPTNNQDICKVTSRLNIYRLPRDFFCFF